MRERRGEGKLEFKANRSLCGLIGTESSSDPWEILEHTFQTSIFLPMENKLQCGGRMGVVYKAEDTRLRRHAVLKLLPAGKIRILLIGADLSLGAGIGADD